MARSVLCVVGARPNFMKIAPIMAALKESFLRGLLLHTGQHYDSQMNERFFEELGIPAPEVNLEVGSGSHAQQTAQVMMRFEPELDRLAPDLVLVVGDVNSTLACALVAAKKNVAVAHVEAGLRSFDRSMPEEINRVLTDQLADLLFVTEASGRINLLREGIDGARIHMVGNVMIDTLHRQLAQAVPARQTLGSFAAEGAYGVVTLHRPSNVDDPKVLAALLDTLAELARRLPLVFALHPRTQASLERHGLMARLDAAPIKRMPPLGYQTMLGLIREARLVLTDSGGLQEETTALGVPCLTLRDTTERPITLEEGTNQLVGNDPARIQAGFERAMGGARRGRIPALWDGKAAERIVTILATWMESRA